jgi:hypothetical protein
MDPKRICCDLRKKHPNVRITPQIVPSREVRSLIVSGREDVEAGSLAAFFISNLACWPLSNPQVFKSIVATGWV